VANRAAGVSKIARVKKPSPHPISKIDVSDVISTAKIME